VHVLGFEVSMKIAQFISMVLVSLVTGVFWGTWFSLSRSIASITPTTFLEVGHTMITNLGGPMSVLMPAACISLALVMVLLYRRRYRTGFWFTTMALALLLVALAITLTVNVPIDDQIRGWTVEMLPADWMAIRDRWEFYHGLRTVTSIAALGCLFAGALWPDWRHHVERAVSRRAA
jgi:uncharacterized membrane protein